MNLYEFTYTKTKVGVTKERKYQIPAETELDAAVQLGQMYPEDADYDSTNIKIISVKKVG